MGSEEVAQIILLGWPPRELLRLICHALLFAPGHQPGRTARGKGVVPRLSHNRQRLPRKALSGCQTLGLTYTPDMGGAQGIGACIALLCEVAQELRGRSMVLSGDKRLRPPSLRRLHPGKKYL